MNKKKSPTQKSPAAVVSPWRQRIKILENHNGVSIWVDGKWIIDASMIKVDGKFSVDSKRITLVANKYPQDEYKIKSG